MSDRRRRRGATSDEESEDISSASDHGNEDPPTEKTLQKCVLPEKEVEPVEPEFHSAEEDNKEKEERKEYAEGDNKEKEEQKEYAEKTVAKEVNDIYEEHESPTALIDEDGGGEAIAEPEEVEGEFLGSEMLDASEDNEECHDKVEKSIEKREESVSKDKQSVSKDKQSVVNEEISVVNEKKSVDEKKSVNEEKSVVNEEISVVNEEKSTDKEEKGIGKEVKVVVEGEKSVDKEEKEELEDEKVMLVQKDVYAAAPVDKEEISSDKEAVIVEKTGDIHQEENLDKKEYSDKDEECIDEEDDDDEYGEDEEGDDECEDEEDDEECVKQEREQGDGEECTPNGAAEKELDFDEDRRNPQYIPKKGIFYEHDDRNTPEEPKEAEVDLTRDKKKKKLWLDDGKWGHDRYREDEQIPKSRNELVEAYGYDIRCEDGPPRARRRRRYGRGPTKYEPNWSEEAPGKERTLGMFIRRGTRGGRPRGRFRGNSFRGTGRQFSKSESEDSYKNNNIDEDRTNIRKNSFNSAPRSPRESNFCNWKSDDLPLNSIHKPLKGNDLCGWTSEKTPVANVVKQTKDETLCGWESDEEPVPTPNVKQTKEENLCGWESDDCTPATQPVKQMKSENPPGWETNNNAPVTHIIKQTKTENLNRWDNNKALRTVKQPKEENLCGWETDESPAGEEPPAPVSLNTKEFPALPTKEVLSKPLPSDKNSAFTKRKPLIPDTEPLQTNSVRSQTFENSSFSNRTQQSYEKPPRHEGKTSTYRSTIRGGGGSSFKRMPRGRQTRGNDRYSGCDSYLKPTLGPRLLEKQVNRISADLDRINLNHRNESYENAEDLGVYEQKRNLNKQNSHLISSSKNEDSANRPKRYSSLRQRTLPETTAYQSASTSVPPPHPSPYYDTGYQTAMYAPEAVTPAPQPPSSGSPPVINPPQYQAYNPQPYPEGYSLRMPVNNPPRLFPQVTVPAGQPIMTPPPCITPNPTLMNYPPPAAAPPAYPPQYAAYQQYTAPPPPPPPPVSQTPDMFRGGITYYYTQPQPPPVRQVPLKRPKAAIPIVPPPENKRKGDGRQEVARLEELQCADVDSAIDRTDSSTLQAHAPLEVES